jgi:hypothetical protein
MSEKIPSATALNLGELELSFCFFLQELRSIALRKIRLKSEKCFILKVFINEYY